MFGSWCNSRLYDLVFGWGKHCADYSELVCVFLINFIIFTNTRLSNGVEGWVLLHQEDMAKPEFDEELLAFATMDLSLVSMK